MRELGLAVDNHAIAAHYADWLDGMIVHEGDRAPEHIAIARTDTLMSTIEDRCRVARAALDLAADIRGGSRF